MWKKCRSRLVNKTIASPRLKLLRQINSRHSSLSAAENIYLLAGTSPFSLTRRVEVRIANFADVFAAFGKRCADQIVSEVAQAFCGLLDDCQLSYAEVIQSCEDRFSFVLADDADLLSLHACCVAVASTPVVLDQVPILPVLSIVEMSKNLDWNAGGMNWRISPPPFQSTDHRNPDSNGSRTLAGAYAAEMAAMASLVSGLRDDAIQLTWQPVRRADNRSGLLYRELSLGRIQPENGATVPVQDELIVAERLGLRPLIDCMVASRAIDELTALPDLVIGIKISSLSARPGFWWTELTSRLAEDHTLGPRLILQIGGTASLPPLRDAIAFMDRMRSFGCSVVIDDFGIDYSSIRSIMALKPDGIRIAPLFLQRAQLAEVDRKIFNHLAGLAQAMCETVIASGVENACACEIASQAGVVWQQGRHHGSPSQIHSWGNCRRGLANSGSFSTGMGGLSGGNADGGKMIPSPNQGDATSVSPTAERSLPELSTKSGHPFLGLLWGIPLSLSLWILIGLVVALA